MGLVKRLLYVGLCSGVLLVAADQALLRLALGDGYLLGRRIAPFDPPFFTPDQERAWARLNEDATPGRPSPVERLFDSELGWAPPRAGELGEKHFDERGARRPLEEHPRRPLPGVRRVLVFGGSFTLGDEVQDVAAWPRLLDEQRVDLEVVNLGMSAYGVDQAYLRFLREADAWEADEVWLGWLPRVSARVTTQYRPALRHGSGPILFKPRFRLRGGELELLPNPAPSLDDVRELLGDQAAFMRALEDADSWVMRAPAAYSPTGSSPWHMTGFGRLGLTLAERGGREPRAWFAQEHGEVRALIEALVVAFDVAARERGVRFRLLILPDRDDLAGLASGEACYWEASCETLGREGIEVLDTTLPLAERGLHTQPEAWAPHGHCTELGNRLIAEVLSRAVSCED